MSETFHRYNFHPPPVTENFLKRPFSSNFDLSSPILKRPYLNDISCVGVNNHGTHHFNPFPIPGKVEQVAFNEAGSSLLAQKVNNDNHINTSCSPCVDENSINSSSQSIGMKKLNLNHFRSNTHSLLQYLLINISKILNTGKLNTVEQRTLKALTSVVLLSMCHTSAIIACRKIIEVYKQHKHLDKPELHSLFSALLRCGAVFFHVQSKNGTYEYIDGFQVTESYPSFHENVSYGADKQVHDEKLIEPLKCVETQNFPYNTLSTVDNSNMPPVQSRIEVSNLQNNEMNCKSFSASERDSMFTGNFYETLPDSSVHLRVQTSSAEPLSHEGEVNYCDRQFSGALEGSAVSENCRKGAINMFNGVVGSDLNQDTFSKYIFENQTCYLRSEKVQDRQSNENSENEMIIEDSPMSPTPETPPRVNEHNDEIFVPSLNQIHELLSDPNQLQKTIELLFKQKHTQEMLSPQLNPPIPHDEAVVAMPVLNDCPPNASPQAPCLIPPPIFNFPPPCYSIGLNDNGRNAIRPVSKPPISPPPYNSTLAHMQGPIRPVEMANSSQNFNVQRNHPNFWSQPMNFSRPPLSNPCLPSSNFSNYGTLNVNNNNNNDNNSDYSFELYDALPAKESSSFEDISPPCVLNSGYNVFSTDQTGFNFGPLHLNSGHSLPSRLFPYPNMNPNQFPQDFSIPPPNIHIQQRIYQCQPQYRFPPHLNASNLNFNDVRYPSQNVASPASVPCHLGIQRNLYRSCQFNIHSTPNFLGIYNNTQTPDANNERPQWMLNASDFHFNNRNATHRNEPPHSSQMLKAQLKTEFICKRCERRFPLEKLYLDHMQNHIKCTIPGCNYEASPKLVNLHFENVHLTGVFEKMKEIDMDNIQQWVQERKRNYPTLDKCKAAAEIDEKKCTESDQVLLKCNGRETEPCFNSQQNKDEDTFLDIGDLAELNTKTANIINKLNRSDRRKRTKGGAEPFDPSRRKFYKASLLEKLLAPEIRRERSFVMQCISYIIARNFFDDDCKDLEDAEVSKSTDAEKENCEISC